jgi:Tol biopolymer transport system component
MIDEHQVREMLHRRANVVPAIVVDAPKAARRARRRLLANGAIAMLAAAAIAVATFAGIDATRSAPIPADRQTTSPAPGVLRMNAEVLSFTDDPETPGDLVAVNPETGEERVLVGNLDDVVSATWSADGQWVAYGGNAGLWVVGPELEPRPVTSGSLPLWSRSWSWSPEGARLAILEGSSLSILDVASESTTELGTVTGDVTFAPVWSPDGTELVYGARGGAVSSVDVGSGEQSVLVEIPGDDLDSMDEMAWSPDGKWLAINYDVEPGVARLYLVDADGSDVRVLCDDNGDNDECGAIAWSPDGAQLAYLEYLGGPGPRIMTQSPYGDSPVLVGKADFGSCAFGGCGFPVWSPDGSRIAVHGGFENGDAAIFLAVDADGTGNVEPIDGMTYQSWYDGSYYLSWFMT